MCEPFLPIRPHPPSAVPLHLYTQVMSPGLRRAREPFRLRNALTGLVLAGFAVGVWAYSIGAVKQDDFDDVDDEARALMASSGFQGASAPAPASSAPETPAAAAATSATPVPAPPVPASPVSPAGASRRRGVLPPLLERRFPKVLDPSTGTLVWGAPPLDNLGKLGDRTRRS